MHHRELKLELSALLLADSIEHDPEYYQRQLKSVFKHEYSVEEIRETLNKIITLWEKVELSKHEEEIIVLQDDYFEGN